MAAFCVDKRGGDRRAFAFIPLRKRSGQKRSRDGEPLCGVAPNRAEPRRNTERLDALDNNAHVHRMTKAADPAQKIYSAADVARLQEREPRHQLRQAVLFRVDDRLAVLWCEQATSPVDLVAAHLLKAMEADISLAGQPVRLAGHAGIAVLGAEPVGSSAASTRRMVAVFFLAFMYGVRFDGVAEGYESNRYLHTERFGDAHAGCDAGEPHNQGTGHLLAGWD